MTTRITTQPSKTQSDNLTRIAEQALSPLGLEVLEVQLQNASGRSPILLIRIDRLDEQPVSVEDLTLGSRTIGAALDELDPIKDEYRLELESPGSKRPLLRARHFERMLGLLTRVRGDGHAFTAAIKAVNGDQVTFDVLGQDVTLSAGTFQANLAEFPAEHR
ncbi:ribosome maturation factor RimP [Deinococcus psychrotolerans]|uniref:Ribosome maturation factor RimP n=1 Tax=Deinococcus psychrotolerans TaxID=2489213 RepID=A0A3G8YA63_9DEIO|nr:ribosome maturation factor RimP [Deinococcus psychrotolerans]AZI42268.1 ribosome maturation factor RimP [Deinococcus psychrotolerans]